MYAKVPCTYNVRQEILLFFLQNYHQALLTYNQFKVLGYLMILN